ncbi:hypothetical protein ABPG75_013414 [Micractinium tetrahymenae]
MEDKILDYGDVLLRRQDALLLLDQNWLNDQVIGFFFEYLAREAFPGLAPRLLLIPGSAAYLLACLGANGGGAAVVLEPHGFPARTQLALFAVNNNPDATAAGGGSHWSLLAWSAADGAFRHYDSMAGSNVGAARRVADAAAAALPGRARARVLEQRGPQQQNAFDCGVYVLALARLLAARHAADGPSISFEVAPDAVSPADVTAVRQEVYALIASKAAAAGTAGGLPPPGS